MKLKFSILYNSGKTDEINQELTEEQFSSITEAINLSFKDGISATIRLGDDDTLNFINLKEVSRVKVHENKE